MYIVKEDRHLHAVLHNGSWGIGHIFASKQLAEMAATMLNALVAQDDAMQKIVERMRADVAYHGEKSQQITHDVLDIDTAPDGAYNVEDDCAESYHSGRESAMADAINLLLGNEVKLYSETE